MIKKMIVGGLLIIIGFFLILFQLSAIDQIKEKDEMLRVYTLAKDLKYGDDLNKDDLDEIYIRKTDNKAEYISSIDDKKYYIINVKKKDSILLKSDISIEKPVDKLLAGDNYNIVTLGLGIEEANAWNFKEFDEVDLYFVSNFPDKENFIYENVIIYKIVSSEIFSDDYSNIKTPQYVSLLVPKEKSYEILSNKRYGRFEIILN
ncbi:MAG: hypothetical protein WBA54_00230 [Acidaminobacteraceae bacterium]